MQVLGYLGIRYLLLIQSEQSCFPFFFSSSLFPFFLCKSLYFGRLRYRSALFLMKMTHSHACLRNNRACTCDSHTPLFGLVHLFRIYPVYNGLDIETVTLIEISDIPEVSLPGIKRTSDFKTVVCRYHAV